MPLSQQVLDLLLCRVELLGAASLSVQNLRTNRAIHACPHQSGLWSLDSCGFRGLFKEPLLTLFGGLVDRAIGNAVEGIGTAFSGRLP